MLELRMASVVHSLVILLGSLFKQHFSDVIIDLYWLYVFQMLKLDLCDSPRGFGDWIPLLSLIWRSVRGIELPDQARTSASSSLRLLQCHGSSYAVATTDEFLMVESRGKKHVNDFGLLLDQEIEEETELS
jgi:hypothetical protein